ncbi:hypothetical protein [Nostoc sp. NMS9]|uniref:hypothetical protein n=1 Tax=Nostoc sp. NMS9 TaxID=2815393 RepID=UPI0025E6882E|nr:hypothetical protein [Nostoc sp. NMS9]MBN3940474.1 hypothetical protein [Nostoc sp. NMS9]
MRSPVVNDAIAAPQSFIIAPLNSEVAPLNTNCPVKKASDRLQSFIIAPQNS